MSLFALKLTLDADGRDIVTNITRVDLLRMERITKESASRFLRAGEITNNTLFRLVWFALQRERNEVVAPFKELNGLSLFELDEAVDALSVVADVNWGPAKDEADGPKASDPVPTTGD